MADSQSYRIVRDFQCTQLYQLLDTLFLKTGNSHLTLQARGEVLESMTIMVGMSNYYDIFGDENSISLMDAIAINSFVVNYKHIFKKCEIEFFQNLPTTIKYRINYAIRFLQLIADYNLGFPILIKMGTKFDDFSIFIGESYYYSNYDSDESHSTTSTISTDGDF